ncbi:MAG TPA: response regulator [Bacteroidales bacterium]|nr:response regulator [Bacteroidales bacterium]HRW96259.1 response regulator [Bacteroidales bacterium]
MTTEYIPKILIIDDLEVNLITLGGNLRKLKAEIFKAQSGNEALIRIKQHDFALIIIDIQMPGMNGYEVAEQIRQGRRNQFTPIIFLTAVYFDQLSVYKGYQTGAVDYITKPFNFDILISKVRVFLDLDRIRHELVESRKQFVDVVQDQTDMICRTYSDMTISFANNSMLTALNTELEAIVGVSIFSWVSDDDQKKINNALTTLNPTSPLTEIYHTLVTSPTHQLSVSSFIRALFNEEYELSGYQWVIRDITDEIFTREQLLKAKQKAEEATKSKSRFLANMSHEARNPLNSILGMIDLLSESDLNAEQRESLNVMQYSAKKLHQLLNDILDLSRIEANRIKLEIMPFNLFDELQTLVKSYESQVYLKQNKLKLTINQGVPKNVKSDPLRLSQIISNLISNANKFTNKGTIELIVSPLNVSGKKADLKFEVKDTGIGITQENINIFEDYEQGDNSITRTYRGSGLGLSISKSLCELLGGSLEYSSHPETGTSFWFVLNLEFEDKVTNDKFKNLNFLVVDDNLLNQKVVGSILLKQGITFDVADNGIVAFEKASLKHYDVILMDIQMPEMDGYDATRLIRMRENENNVQKPSLIIALTANATVEDRKKCLDLGMDNYLTKPFNYSDLEPIVEKLLK